MVGTRLRSRNFWKAWQIIDSSTPTNFSRSSQTPLLFLIFPVFQTAALMATLQWPMSSHLLSLQHHDNSDDDQFGNFGKLPKSFGYNESLSPKFGKFLKDAFSYGTTTIIIRAPSTPAQAVKRKTFVPKGWSAKGRRPVSFACPCQGRNKWEKERRGKDYQL